MMKVSAKSQASIIYTHVNLMLFQLRLEKWLLVMVSCLLGRHLACACICEGYFFGSNNNANLDDANEDEKPAAEDSWRVVAEEQERYDATHVLNSAIQ